MECTPTCYLALAFLSDRLLAYLDASLYQILVVKQQVLFQTGIGDTAGVSDLLCRDISVRTQKFHSLGVLFLTVLACISWQVVAQSQSLAVLLLRFRLGNSRRAGFVMCVIWGVHHSLGGWNFRTAMPRSAPPKHL